MDHIATIKEVIARLLIHMGVRVEAIAVSPQSVGTDTILFSIAIPDTTLLIATHAEYLDAFDHLVRRIVAKKIGAETTLRFCIDINQYKHRRAEALRERARAWAQQVLESRGDVVCAPMTSYDRMVVHTELKTIPNIKTESVGEGRERHIVVKYQQ